MSDTRVPEAVRAAVARAIGRPADDGEIVLRPATPHQSNRLYEVRAQGQHLIAREYLRADRPSAARHEFGALRRVEALHLAPEPVFFDPSVGPVVVYRYMDGEMWDRRGPPAAELAALAELWLQLHALDTDGLWLATVQATSRAESEARLRAPLQAYAAWADSTSPRVRAAARLCLEALERSLAAARRVIPEHTPVCFCRSDARFANVIARTDGRLGLVDWEDSGLRDPAREVADLLLHPNQEDLLDWDNWQPFLTIYRASRRDDPGFEARLEGYLAVFPIFWLSVLLADGMQRLAGGSLDTWRINEMEPNARLRRYLARAQAWPAPDPAVALAKLGDLAFF